MMPSKCYECNEGAEISCANSNCVNEACDQHSFRIAKRALLCQSCYVKDRKQRKGMIWGMYGVLITILVVFTVLNSLV